MSSSYSATALTPAEVQALPGMTLIEFGTDWCGCLLYTSDAADE